MMHDKDSFVQEAACTALVHAIEKGDPSVVVGLIGYMIEAFKLVIDVY